MLSTTKILSQIQSDFKKSKGLECYLPSLIQSLESKKKVVLSKMNAKQKLTQVQQLIQSELKKIQETLQRSNIDLENDEEPIQQQSAQQYDEDDMQMNDGEDGQDHQQEQLDQGEEEFEENLNDELDEQDEEFKEPEFSKKNNRKIAKVEEMIDQQEENYDQAEEEYPEGEGKADIYGQDQQDQDAFEGEDDVGLYGQQLNDEDEDIEDYENEFDEEEFKQFEQQFGDGKAAKKDKKKKSQQQEDDEDPDDHVNENFDHFRQIQLQNQKNQEVETVQKTDLDHQIDRLEDKVFGKKDWVMKGEVKARERPANSLLEYDLQFNSGVKFSHEITEERNSELEELIKKRVLNDMFDDRTRFVNSSHIREHFGSLKQVSREKSQMGLGEIYESQFKNFLGIGQDKNNKLKAQIMDSFKQLNYFLDSLSNFSFVPKPTKDSTKKGQSEAIIVEEKVPLTLWNGQKDVQKQGKLTFESQKQVDRQAKRLKNKRIARQRKKEQINKKLNKIIEYGGITKFEAQAKKKAQMNNKPLKIDGTNMKYNKSSSFFKNMNENKGGKPNPNISKMKI